MKWLILLMLLVMLPMVASVCCEKNKDCTVTETCQDGACGDCLIVVYNPVGSVNMTAQNFTQETVFTYTINLSSNLTGYGTYPYTINCSTNKTCEDDCNVEIKKDCEGNEGSMIGALLLIPLGLCFLFIYFANSLNEEQEPMKWFMRLLALVMVFVVYVGADIATGIDTEYSAMRALFNIQIFGYIFWSVMAVFLVLVIYKIFDSLKQKKADDFDRGVV